MTQRLELVYDDTPPSLNKTAHAHWRVFQRNKRRWQTIFSEQLLNFPGRMYAAEDMADHVHATAVLRFRLRRTRDEGNYRSLLEKSLGDALTSMGVIADDDPEHFTFGALTFDPDPGDPRTIVTLQVETKDERRTNSV